MIFLNKRLPWNLLLSVVLVLVMVFAVACTSSSGSNTETEQETEPEEGNEHEEGGEHDESEEPERVPNEGAVIRILTPADGASLKSNEDIVVQIETENFALGEEERHWEVYVDGASYASVEGGNTDAVLRGLDMGEHEISVFMSLGSHQQFQDGDSITITVEE